MLSACSGGFGGGGGGIWPFTKSTAAPTAGQPAAYQAAASSGSARTAAQATEFEQAAGRAPERDDAQTPVQSLFYNSTNSNTTVKVNKYLWNASLDVLNFLPIQSIDPFSGVIVTGFGSPPGGGGSYRATIYVQDPALDARSLKVALVGKGGPVSPDVQRAVEDAILTRARQLRIQDTNL